MVYATRGLATVLLDYAREREPSPVTVPLAVTAAGELDSDLPELSPETPVFTHFYLPDVGGSVEAVFGVDLGTPPGQTPGVFVSHPDGTFAVERTDELREIVLVAVPPWDDASLGAFDRGGAQHSLTIVDAELPRESAP